MKFPPYTTDKNGLNVKIKCHVLSDDKMRKYHFTDLAGDSWYYMQIIKLPLKYHSDKISFNLSIKKDESSWQLDVLDEDFLQPFDYQNMIESFDTPPKIALLVYEQVEKIMADLAKKGIVTGHVYGEYI